MTALCTIKAVFHFARTNDMDTIEYATFRYDAVEEKNGL